MSLTRALLTVLAIWCGCVAVYLTSRRPAFAAYTTATIMLNELQENGTYKVRVRFSGAGEPDKFRETFLVGGMDALALKRWAIAQKRDLDDAKTLASSQALQEGQSIDLTDITIPAAEQARIDWTRKVNRLRALRAMQIQGVSALSTDIDALETDIETTYQNATGPQRAALLASF